MKMTDNNKYEKKIKELLEKQEARQLTEEELAQVNGGLKLDPERLRKKVEDVYPV